MTESIQTSSPPAPATTADANALLRETLQRMQRQSPFFRNWFHRHHILPQAITNLEQLPQLPLLDRATLAAAGRDAWCVNPSEVVDVVTTSGSTGRPLLFPLTAGDVEHLAINEEQSFRCAGLDANDRVILGVTMDRCFMAGLAYFEGLRRIGAMSLRVGAASPAMMIEMIERLDATAVVSVPGFLGRVADYAANHDIDLRRLGVNKLICIGEPVRFTDLSPTPLTQRLQTAWDTEVLSTFGATEIASSMCECPRGRGGHLHPTLHHVEILNEAGEPQRDGDLGEVVVSTFGLQAMPLVRYRLGDLAWLDHTPCPCGQTTPRLGPIAGRLQQRLKLKGVSVDPAMVPAVLTKFPQILDSLLIATCDADGCDQLEVMIAVEPEDAPPTELLYETLRGALKVLPKVTRCNPEAIEALRNGDRRKRQWFLDRRR